MRRILGVTAGLIVLSGAFALGLGVTRAHDRSTLVQRVSTTASALPRPIEQVRHELRVRYYREVPRDVLTRATIPEIVTGLRDPYTSYLSPRAYAIVRARTAESYSGVGLTVGRHRAGLIVKAAAQGPARAAGIQPGDRIVSVDGRRVRRLAFDRSLALIQGREGTTVHLTVRRPREGTLSFTVKRREIELPAVRSRLVTAAGTRLAHVRVVAFRSGTADAVSHAVERLQAAGAKGVVLDLRDNPGGLLSQAVATVSLFVDGGTVCVTEGLHRGRRAYAVTGTAPLKRVPLVVLVDRGSASAAEVVAAALDDHARAPVVGVRTYGKASVQLVRPLSNGGALRMTTAIFLTPTGKNLTDRGLRPDVHAVDRPRTRVDEALARAQATLVEQLS